MSRILTLLTALVLAYAVFLWRMELGGRRLYLCKACQQ